MTKTNKKLNKKWILAMAGIAMTTVATTSVISISQANKSTNLANQLSNSITLKNETNEITSKNIVSSTNTKLIKDKWTINADDKLFKLIFGIEDKGFAVDWWSKELADKENKFINYVNSHLGKFLKDYQLKTINDVSIYTTRLRKADFVYSKNKIRTKLIFDNWFDNDFIRNNIIVEGKIDIDLRLTPKGNDIGNLTIELQNLFSENKNNPPTPDQIRQRIVDVLNNNIDDLPDAVVKDSGKFKVSDINLTDEQLKPNEFGAINIPAFSIGDGYSQIEFDSIRLGSFIVKEQENLFLWIILGSVSLVLFILVIMFISYIVKQKKKHHNNYDYHCW